MDNNDPLVNDPSFDWTFSGIPSTPAYETFQPPIHSLPFNLDTMTFPRSYNGPSESDLNSFAVSTSDHDTFHVGGRYLLQSNYPLSPRYPRAGQDMNMNALSATAGTGAPRPHAVDYQYQADMLPVNQTVPSVYLHGRSPYPPVHGRHRAQPYTLERPQPTVFASDVACLLPMRTRCFWGGECVVLMDDITRGGIERHVKDIHFCGVLDRQALILCEWCTDSGRCGHRMAQANLGIHIAAIHLRSTAVVCDGCGKKYSRKDVCQKHKKERCKGVATPL
ncbi:hypothetical protein SCP_1500430 [Sparassis crispa]|uniref:Uncharacterized protein n=1 Tax=Sparassis crispa TaxID=139825 RepID=A0A401H3R3_9APHY|nr:hypothetical protein SCP_1500430 [Sparassis crispa]GBE89041.1 hypothetical protein SCP_1500430 [Sparassis crispa]